MQKIILLFLFTSFVFSQSKTSTLEDKIYNSVDAFVANPTNEGLQKLEVSEKKFSPKSKSEWLAFVILKCNKAFYENQLGFTNKAISNYEKAWQLYQKKQLSNYDIIESCLQPLGNLYTIIGDYENAENTIKQYFYIANVTNNQQQKYSAIVNLSNVYQNTGKVNEAIDLLEKTIATEKLTNAQKGILYTNLGNNYFLSTVSIFSKRDAYTKGEAAYQKAITLLKSEKNQAETLSIAYRNLAKRYAITREYELANSYMENAKVAFELIPNLEPRKKAQFYFDEAVLQFRQKKITEASQSLSAIFKILIPNYTKSKTLLPNKNSLYAETVLLDALDLQAEIYLAKNQPERALKSYDLAFHIEGLFQSLLVYENSKIITQIRNRNRTEKNIAIYYALYQKKKRKNYLESALLLSEQTKSAILKQAISNSKTRSREEKILLEQLQNWNTIIVKEQQKLEKADISKINQAIKKQNQLMLLLKSKIASKTNESETLSIPDLYSKLEKDNAVMVEYFFGRENMYVFTIENKTINMQAVQDKFNGNLIINEYLSFFKDANSIVNNPIGFKQFSHNVYNFLKLPKKNSNENLIIIPDGILNFVPFESLITRVSSNTNFSKMQYLLNDFKVGYSNSADFYLNAIPFQHKNQNVLGVFPVFEKTNLELAFSKKELQNIQANFDGKYLESQEASFENFMENAANYSILHLSTHASSGDISEPASIKFYDREVLYSEFYNLNLNPDLVVLSACETGIGKLYKAEGPMSVARGFQFAGAQNLLFSLWKVNDFTTSVLMEKFYSNVKKGESYFDSNHQAKLDFLNDETISNTKKSPYYWSAFVYYGTLENPSHPNYFLWISIVAGLIALLLLWTVIFRKK